MHEVLGVCSVSTLGGATTGIPVDDVAHLISGSTAMVPRARLDTFTRAWFKARSYRLSCRSSIVPECLPGGIGTEDSPSSQERPGSLS
jgi:hypothetical protein